jgi:histone chaperone ASF1
VGSSESSEYDQILEEVLVGPVTAGCHKFVLQADAPDPTKLAEILGVTVVLIACSYQNHEFVRIGYYVNNEREQNMVQQVPFDDDDDMQHQEDVLTSLDELPQVIRTTLADKPRVTRFSIPWHSTPTPLLAVQSPDPVTIVDVTPYTPEKLYPRESNDSRDDLYEHLTHIVSPIHEDMEL